MSLKLKFKKIYKEKKLKVTKVCIKNKLRLIELFKYTVKVIYTAGIVLVLWHLTQTIL